MQRRQAFSAQPAQEQTVPFAAEKVDVLAEIEFPAGSGVWGRARPSAQMPAAFEKQHLQAGIGQPNRGCNARKACTYDHYGHDVLSAVRRQTSPTMRTFSHLPGPRRRSKTL